MTERPYTLFSSDSQYGVKLEFHGTDTDTDTDFRDMPIV